MFQFKDIRDILKKYPIDEINDLYDTRACSLQEENNKIIRKVIAEIDPDKKLFHGDNLKENQLLLSLLIKAKFGFDGIDSEKANELLRRYNYRVNNELIPSLYFKDDYELGKMSLEEAIAIMKCFLSIQDFRQIDEKKYEIKTDFGDAKVLNLEKALGMEHVNPDERHRECHLLTDSALYYTPELFAAYYHIPCAFNGYFDHSVVLSKDQKVLADYANNFMISYEFFKKYYGEPAFIISGEELRRLNKDVYEEFGLTLTLPTLETIRLLRKKQD